MYTTGVKGHWMIKFHPRGGNNIFSSLVIQMTSN
jgi:hypothetical protein